MYLLVGIKSKLIAEVIESNLVRGRVSDVRRVGALPLLRCHTLLDVPGFESEVLVDAPHPGRIPPREIVVDRHDVDAPACLRVVNDGGYSSQRLAFSGL